MELLAQSNLSFVLARPQRALAASGAFLAFVALIIAVCVPAFLDAKEAPPKALPHVLADSAVKIKARLAHREIHAEPIKQISWKTALMVGGAFAGFLGAALGTASWVRRDNTRLSGIAISAGLTAIAWNFFLAAAIAAVSLFLLAWVISHFHR